MELFQGQAYGVVAVPSESSYHLAPRNGVWLGIGCMWIRDDQGMFLTKSPCDFGTMTSVAKKTLVRNDEKDLMEG